MGIPFTDLELTRYQDGSFANVVLVKGQGGDHFESFVTEPASSDEFLRGWISKESRDNSLELVIYEEPKADGNSKLINSRVPIGQEVWGNCQLPQN